MFAMLMFGARFTVCDVDAGRSEEVVVGVERVAVTVLDTPGPWAGKEKKMHLVNLFSPTTAHNYMIIMLIYVKPDNA